MANKAKQIRDLLGLGHRDLEFCRCDIIETHPSAWYVDGVDRRGCQTRQIAAQPRRGTLTRELGD
jgi:hypothetical protein